MASEFDRTALFEKVVALCGVSAVLAPGMVKRALTDGRVHPDAATIADYRAAIPRILARLRAYMPDDEAQRRARKIGAVLTAIESGVPLDQDSGELSLSGRVSEVFRGATPSEGLPRAPITTPSEGTTRAPIRTPVSGVNALPDARSDDFDDIFTLHGRRYTEDEREVLRRSVPPPPERKS